MSIARYLSKMLLNSSGEVKSLGIENTPYMLKGVVILDGTEPGFPTYTPPAGVRALEVEVIGAGGGGGGADGDGTYAATGAAGGGGGWARTFLTNLSASYTYAVGAGGTGVLYNNTASNGGTTSFTDGTVTVQATGGDGGLSDYGDTSSARVCSTGGQGSLVNCTGTFGGGVRGSAARYTNVISTTQTGTRGFCPIVGQSSVRGYGNAGAVGNGTNATLVGEGGSGAYNSATTTNYQGGNGFRGEIRIKEYY
jgi:hypothetical protein